VFCRIVAVVRRGFRAVYDGVMFHAVIKSRGHVPSQDGFTVRRIAGPGLASNYYYQVVTLLQCRSNKFNLTVIV
jgi:hypothetical protein